jgi:hypothetical protein
MTAIANFLEFLARLHAVAEIRIKTSDKRIIFRMIVSSVQIEICTLFSGRTCAASFAPDKSGV